jgi:hypothetical protein
MEMAEMRLFVTIAGYRILDHTCNGDIKDNLGVRDINTTIDLS